VGPTQLRGLFGHTGSVRREAAIPGDAKRQQRRRIAREEFANGVDAGKRSRRANAVSRLTGGERRIEEVQFAWRRIFQPNKGRGKDI